MTEDLRLSFLDFMQKVTKIEERVLDGSLLEVENMSITTYIHINQFLTSYAQHKYVIERSGDGDWR